MLDELKILGLLKAYTDAEEPPPQELAERIKAQIPPRLMAARAGANQPISIFIHLRVNRLAAAAIIVASLVVFYAIFGGRTHLQGGIISTIHDLVGWQESGTAGLTRLYHELTSNGREVVFFEHNADRQDPTLILMYWQLPEGDYRVVFSNGRVTRVDAQTLIGLQASMIQRMGK